MLILSTVMNMWVVSAFWLLFIMVSVNISVQISEVIFFSYFEDYLLMSIALDENERGE